MGGIAGHAGLFSTAPDVLSIMREWLFNDPRSQTTYLNATTTSLFVKEWNQTQSSRALGWNTNDPAVFDQGWNLSCGKKLSPQTYTHTGYTGTQVCADPNFPTPTGPLITILLTNRYVPEPFVSFHPAHGMFANNNQIIIVCIPRIPLVVPRFMILVKHLMMLSSIS
jgi:CubicO group peptidase (beta-lactamase class C family)